MERAVQIAEREGFAKVGENCHHRRRAARHSGCDQPAAGRFCRRAIVLISPSLKSSPPPPRAKVAEPRGRGWRNGDRASAPCEGPSMHRGCHQIGPVWNQVPPWLHNWRGLSVTAFCRLIIAPSSSPAIACSFPRWCQPSAYRGATCVTASRSFCCHFPVACRQGACGPRHQDVNAGAARFEKESEALVLQGLGLHSSDVTLCSCPKSAATCGVAASLGRPWRRLMRRGSRRLEKRGQGHCKEKGAS